MAIYSVVLFILSVSVAHEVEVGFFEKLCKSYNFNEHACKHQTDQKCIWGVYNGKWGECYGKSQVDYRTQCVDGIVDSGRTYLRKMTFRQCGQEAKNRGVSWVWGNGERCYVYYQLLDIANSRATDGKGSWMTCSGPKIDPGESSLKSVNRALKQALKATLN